MKTYLVLILISVLLCSGCISVRYVKMPERYPEYELPPKADIAKVTSADLAPLAPDTRTKVESTVKNLKGEAAYLRKVLERYNEYAAERNKDYYDYIEGR